MEKKFISIFLILVMLLSISIPTFAATASSNIIRLAGNDRYYTSSAIAIKWV